MRSRIIFLVGGPEVHPTSKQADAIIESLGGEYFCHKAESIAAFEHLDECDLLVVMGTHRVGDEEYRSPTESNRRAFEKYIQSGKPVLSAHAGIASYNDWPRFGELLGFSWIDGKTSESLVAKHDMKLINTRHPILTGLSDYRIVDDLISDVQFSAGMDIQVHAQSEWNGRRLPIIITAEGGRTAGAGKTTYLANGHDMRAFECPMMKPLWMNAVRWSLGRG